MIYTHVNEYELSPNHMKSDELFLKFPRGSMDWLVFTYDALVPGQFRVGFMIFRVATSW